MPTRVYIPATVSELRRLSRDGRLGSPPLLAYAVTLDLRQAHPTADEEELEYLALVEAAQGRPAAVVAADVEAETVHETVQETVQETASGGGAPGVVRLTAPVAMRQLAAFHLPGDPGPTGEPELSWYDATELDVVLDVLSHTD